MLAPDARPARGAIPGFAMSGGATSTSERAELAGMLIESLDGEPDEEVEAAWAEEVERRVREIDRGELKTIPWEQVKKELGL